MGRLVSDTSMTVDGLCDVGAWFVAEGDHDAAGVDQLAVAAGFVTGRKCYEGFLGYWPSATGPWAEVLNPMPKYVASRTLSGDLDWNAHVIEGDAVDGIRRLGSSSESFSRVLDSRGLISAAPGPLRDELRRKGRMSFTAA
jgi:dihydrofolate reductase